MSKLKNKKVAILATDGFEEVELAEPRKALEEAGADTYIIAPDSRIIKAWNHDKWSDPYEVDVSLEDADPDDFDALLIPGGVINPDKLRTNRKAIEFVMHFLHSNKPVAAICHGPQLLIETNALDGIKMTSYKSIRTDLMNAGADWVDQEVVVDRQLITSRNPSDIPAFNDRIIEEFSKTHIRAAH